MNWQTPKEIDLLHLSLLALVCSLILTLPIMLTINQSNDNNRMQTVLVEPGPEQPAKPIGERGVEYLPTVNHSDVLNKSDITMWVAADSQPDWSNGSKPYKDWSRLNAGAEDIAQLPVTPELTALLGDIPDPNSEATDNRSPVSPEKNIQMTRESYERIPWFQTGKNTVYTTGNHERTHLNKSEQAFGRECGNQTLVQSDQGNIKILGICRNADSRLPRSELTALDKRLNKLAQDETDWNVFIALHHPIENTVSNCHSIRTSGAIGMSTTDRYLNITRQHSDIVSATLTGHIHGRWRDPGRSVVQTENQTFIDAPVFAGRVTKSTDTTCDSHGYGVTNSMFISFKENDTNATAVIRNSCDDADSDGECNRQPYWSNGGTIIPLDNPVNTDLQQSSEAAKDG